MKYPQYIYVDAAIGSVANRNNVVDVTSFKSLQDKEAYKTYFRFREDYLKHFKLNKSVAQFKGKGYADFLPIDIDSDNLEEAYSRARELIEYLFAKFEFDAKHLFFSGSKGFHIFLPSSAFGYFEPSENLGMVFRNIAKDILGEIPFDEKIYDMNRLLRVSNSINSKSGLFKIPLSFEEFAQGLDHILELAKLSQENKHPSLDDYVINPGLKDLYLKYKLNGKPKELKSDKILSVFKEGVNQGDRDNSGISIAGYLVAKKLPGEWIRGILHHWNQSNTPPLTEEQINKCVNSALRYKSDSFNPERDVLPVWTLSNEYKSYLQNGSINTGFRLIDERLRGIMPGEVLTIEGFTGNFKSVFLQYVLRNYVHSTKEPVLFFEMEMSRFNVYQRSAQIANKYNFKDFTTYAGSDSQTDREIVSEGIKHDHEKLYLCDKSGLTLDEIRNIVIETQINIGRKIKVIGVDYIQLMDGPGKSKVEMVDLIAKNLKNLAKELDLVVFSVSQVTGLESRYDKIKLGMVRDSKTIEHASDYVLTLRMKTNTEDNQIIEIIKNRGGRCQEFLIPIDPERLQYDFDSMAEYKSNVI